MKLHRNKRIGIVLSISDLDLRQKLYILLKRVTIEKEKKCWLIDEDWTKYKQYDKQPAHRWMFSVLRGPIDSDKIICHHCDRPGCINPDHLYQGTPKSNYQDAIRRGRITRSKINYRIDPLKLDEWAWREKDDDNRNLK